MQVMASYEAWFKLIEHVYNSWQGDRLCLIFQNSVSLGNINKIQCDGVLFYAFSLVYWARHIKWLHCVNKVANTFGKSSSLIIVRLIIVLDNLQGVKTMQSSNFVNDEEIREGLLTYNHKKGIHSKETAKKHAEVFFEEYEKTLRSNARVWMEKNLPHLAIGGIVPTSDGV